MATGAASEPGWRTWREATTGALYGPGGFFRRTCPAAHFRTSPQVSAAFARALLRLAADHGLRTVVDVGSGRGELLRTLYELDPALHLVAVEVADRPDDLPEAVDWTSTLPARLDGLVVANEWLDNVPVDVAEVDREGVVRTVLVDPTTGDERLGEPVGERDCAWLDRWWPLPDAAPGGRAEIGWPRDEAWAAVVRRLDHGLAVAIDYAHERDARPPFGTLTGYREGREVRPVLDGSCDITAHVALDACAAAGVAAGAAGSTQISQRDALRRLGLAARRPPLRLARTDPPGYLAALSRVGEYAELTSPDGLGRHCWLLQAPDHVCELPPPSTDAEQRRADSE